MPFIFSFCRDGRQFFNASDTRQLLGFQMLPLKIQKSPLFKVRLSDKKLLGFYFCHRKRESKRGSKLKSCDCEKPSELARHTGSGLICLIEPPLVHYKSQKLKNEGSKSCDKGKRTFFYSNEQCHFPLSPFSFNCAIARHF